MPEDRRGQCGYQPYGRGRAGGKDDDTVKLLEMPGLHVSYLYFNMVNGPTKDPKVREADQGCKREELTGGVYQYGEAVPASLPLPPGSWGYDEAVKAEVPTYDPEAAKALLAEAGYPDGFDLNLYISNTPTRVKMATLFQAYLQQNLNVNVNINTSEWGTSARLALPDRQMCLVCHGHGIRIPTSS